MLSAKAVLTNSSAGAKRACPLTRSFTRLTPDKRLLYKGRACLGSPSTFFGDLELSMELDDDPLLVLSAGRCVFEILTSPVRAWHLPGCTRLEFLSDFRILFRFRCDIFSLLLVTRSAGGPRSTRRQARRLTELKSNNYQVISRIWERSLNRAISGSTIIKLRKYIV
jgi:hypothetical protein